MSQAGIKPDYQVQVEDELVLLANKQTCPANSSVLVRINSENLDLNKLKQLIENDFNDLAVMDAVACFISTLDIGKSIPGLTNSQVINHWFNLGRPLAVQGAIGSVYAGGIRQLDDLFIVKFLPHELNEKTDRVDLIHENFIGVVGTNPLRAYDLGFAYVFPMIKCPRINLGDGAKSLCYSNSNENITHLIYERIPGDTLEKTIQKGTLNPRTFLTIFLQLLQTLQVGSQVEFMHCDFHAGNIVLRPVANTSIKLFTGQYVDTNVIPTIIDFGLSRVNLNGKVYGSITNTELLKFVNPTVYNPMVDIYKLLAHVFNLAVINRQENLATDPGRYRGLLSLCSILLNMLGERIDNGKTRIGSQVIDNPVLFLQKVRSSYFYPLGNLPNLSISDYLDRMMQNPVLAPALNNVLTSNPNYTDTLLCTDTSCFADTASALADLGINTSTPDMPHDLLELVYFMRLYPNEYQTKIPDLYYNNQILTDKYQTVIQDLINKTSNRLSNVLTQSQRPDMTDPAVQAQILNDYSSAVDNIVILNNLYPLFDHDPQGLTAFTTVMTDLITAYNSVVNTMISVGYAIQPGQFGQTATPPTPILQSQAFNPPSYFPPAPDYYPPTPGRYGSPSPLQLYPMVNRPEYNLNYSFPGSSQSSLVINPSPITFGSFSSVTPASPGASTGVQFNPIRY